jgi:hypothetical protein
MPSVARTPAPDHTRYCEAKLIECRRNILRYARSFARNQHRLVAASLRALFKNKKWLGAHAVEGSSGRPWIDAISLGMHLPTQVEMEGNIRLLRPFRSCLPFAGIGSFKCDWKK